MRTLYRQFVMLVPEVGEPANDIEHALLPEIVEPFVTEGVRRSTEGEANGIPHAITQVIYTVTCDIDRIDTLPFAEDCADQHGCAECLKGRDWAKTYLMEHPGRHIIIGLVTVELP